MLETKMLQEGYRGTKEGKGKNEQKRTSPAADATELDGDLMTHGAVLMSFRVYERLSQLLFNLFLS